MAGNQGDLDFLRALAESYERPRGRVDLGERDEREKPTLDELLAWANEPRGFQQAAGHLPLRSSLYAGMSSGAQGEGLRAALDAMRDTYRDQPTHASVFTGEAPPSRRSLGEYPGYENHNAAEVGLMDNLLALMELTAMLRSAGYGSSFIRTLTGQIPGMKPQKSWGRGLIDPRVGATLGLGTKEEER